jgi:asparagine synthase (glutamine-hydrolysing)
MCGITGLWSADSVAEDTAQGWIHQMTATLAHRGPDGRGTFFDPEAGIGFGHRRLSIVDLSDAGRTPRTPTLGCPDASILVEAQPAKHRGVRCLVLD